MSILAALAVFGDKNLDGRIALSLERSGPWPDDEVAAAQAVVEAFVEAAHRGAFPMPGEDPASSDLALVDPPTVAAAQLGFTLEARNVDARALQLLRQMLSRIEHAGDASLRHINATRHGHGRTHRIVYPVIDDDNEQDQYPEPPAAPGFVVHWDDDVGYSRSRRVLVEFPHAIEGEPVDTFIEYVEAWGKLLEASAFALPAGMPDVLDNVMGPVSQFDVVTLEVEIPVYKSSERGFDVLTHLLARFHAQELPIRLMVIE